MKQHLDVLRNILKNGDRKTDRTGTGTISLFGGMMKFSLQHGMWPIPTTREVDHTKISSELEWMLKGMISVKWLNDNDNKIWNSWAGEQSGTIGPMYGEQWRNWNAGITKLEGADEIRLEEMLDEVALDSTHQEPLMNVTQVMEVVKQFLAEKTKPYEQGGRGGTDQLMYVINELKNNPDSRRIVVNVWHAGLLPDTSMSPKENTDQGRMALAPCHSMWQVNTAPMSDFDILREEAYRTAEFAIQVHETMSLNAGLDSEYLQPYIKMLANVFLKKEGYLDDNGVQVNFGDDEQLTITEKGRDEVEHYKALGKPTRKISLACMARSQDVPLGTVFNVGMYSLLCHLLGHLTNMVPWEYTHFMGDHHIYTNQVPFVKEQLMRSPKKPAQIIIDPSLEKIEDFNHKNLTVFYEAHPKIVYPRAAV